MPIVKFLNQRICIFSNWVFCFLVGSGSTTKWHIFFNHLLSCFELLSREFLLYYIFINSGGSTRSVSGQVPSLVVLYICTISFPLLASIGLDSQKVKVFMLLFFFLINTAWMNHIKISFDSYSMLFDCTHSFFLTVEEEKTERRRRKSSVDF